MIMNKSSCESRSYYRLQALKRMHLYNKRPEFKELIPDRENYGIFLGDIYGIGSVYDNAILECDCSDSFKDEQIKQLLKYKMLGYKDIYLFEDGYGIVLGKDSPQRMHLKGIDYLYANLVSYNIDTDTSVKGLCGSRFWINSKTLTITECLDIKDVEQQRLNIDGANTISLAMCYNMWLNCINLDDCTAVISNTNLLHLGIKNSNYINLTFNRCEEVSLYLENTKGKITISNSSVFITFNDPTEANLDNIKIDIAKGSRVRLMSPTKIKITIVDRKSTSEPFSGFASELIKKLMENNNEIQC